MKTTYKVQGINFEWDSQKAQSNLRKHQVSFESACEVFFDPLLQSGKDEIVEGESRETVVGLTKKWKMLFVAYTLRNDMIRIISARFVTRYERSAYENQ